MESFNGDSASQDYSNLLIRSESSKYQLHYTGSNGTAGEVYLLLI